MCGGTLENASGERFLDQYDPETVGIASRTEWNKCFLSFATAREVRAGHPTPHGGVYYVTGDTPWSEFEAKALRSYPNWQMKGADFSELGRALHDGEGVEVAGAAEYFEGGVQVDDRFASSVPGLFAAGECAKSLFGANRVAAATMEMLVAGAIAGKAAGEYARSNPAPPPPNKRVRSVVRAMEAPLRRPHRDSVGLLRRELQEEASAKLGPVRAGCELEGLLQGLHEARAERLPNLGVSTPVRTYNKEWIESLEVGNLLLVLELSARAALERTESRGVHFREDHPTTDNDRWLREIVMSPTDDGIRVEHRPIRATTLPPPSGTVPHLEMIHDMMCAHSDVGGHH